MYSKCSFGEVYHQIYGWKFSFYDNARAESKNMTSDNIPPQKTCLKKFTVKSVLSGRSKRRPKIGFQDRLSLNAGQKYCEAFCNTFDLH